MNWRWVLKMAWRDSRKNRSRLFLFISSIILGIASLVAIKTFNQNLNRNIDRQAAQLLGADLELETNRSPSEEVLAFVDSIASLSIEVAKEQEFMSMVQFPEADGSRLIQVRAIQGSYPFYGTMETQPASAGEAFGKQAEALVDHTLMIQYEARPGDSIQLGLTKLSIAGHLMAQPGQSAVSGALAPSILVPLDQLEDSGLQQTGSRIGYKFYFKFSPGYEVDALVDRLHGRLTQLQLRSETIQTNKEDTGRSFTDMAEFMGLVGFIALLLGCIGVSSAVYIYVREKMVSVAILRCLGASSRQTFFIFLVQFACIGLLGGMAGALIGSLIQYLIPWVVQSFVPFELSSELSWSAVLEGILVGLVISVLFALLPLVAVRNISPLQSLRVSDEPEGGWKDRARWGIYLLIAAFVILFAFSQLGKWGQTLIFSLGLGVIFLLFYSVAKALTYFIRRFFPKRLAYLWRQGLANLYRPNNQTVVLLISIGLGTAMVATLFFVQEMLLQRIHVATDEKQANMLLFDIQPTQLEPIRQMTLDAGLPVVDQVPIVTVQLTGINGRSAREILADTTIQGSSRSINREIRATYRSEMTSTERLVDGKWVSQVEKGDTAQVSLEAGYARRLGVGIGDQLEFNVQGISIPAIVSSTREVDWNQFSTNFRLVFAQGTIDEAPRFYVMMTNIEDAETSARFQQQLVKSFPNISVIDINSVLKILGDLMQKIGFVIQFIGGFSILTGVIVLIASVRISKYQRIRENVLLRTLGASRRQIFIINLSEYFILGFLAALIGLLVATAIAGLLGSFLFEIRFVPPIGPMFVILFLVSLLTTVIGLLNSLVTLNRPPLEILRKN